MKSYKQFVAEANAKVLGKVKGSQVKYKRMDDLGQNPSNYENLDTSGQDPHTLGTGALNTSALKIQLANPTIIDDPDGTPAEKTRIMKPFKGKY
jgi:hypothetical protein